MNWVQRWSIRRRIMLIGVVPVVLAVLMITGYHMYHRWQELHRENEAMVGILLEHLAAAAEYPVMSGNYDLLEAVAGVALRQPSVMAVQVLDTGGIVLYEQHGPRFEQVRQSDLRPFDRPIVQEVPEFGSFADFDDGPMVKRTLGSVRIEVTDIFTRQREASILRQSLLTGLLVVVLSLLAAWGISTTTIPPLERLARFINRLGGEAPVERLLVEGDTEIGLLQGNANRLADTLDQARASQRAYTAQLMEEQRKTQLAAQAKSEFLSMMSHELRTPLNGAVGLVQLLSLDNGQAEFDEYKKTAEDSLMHLTQLLEDVLVLVDSEKRSITAVYEDRDVAKELDGLVKEFSQKALAKRISFVVEYDEYLRHNRVGIDSSVLRQLVRHVAGNAVKFTDRGYVLMRLSVVNHPGRRFLQVRVLDSGIGIPHDKRELVFEAFSQLHSSFSRQYEGVGVGLTITHHILKSLGGVIRIDDNPVGGTEVILEVPMAHEPVPALDDEAKLNLPMRVLVVEDNGVNQKVIEHMLQNVCPQLTIEITGSGEACLAALETTPRPFDLVLMDCQMPGIDGFETTRRMRELDAKTPVVAFTANTSDQVFQQCLDAGMNDFLGKPVTRDALRRVMLKWAAPRYLALPPSLQ